LTESASHLADFPWRELGQIYVPMVGTCQVSGIDAINAMGVPLASSA